MDEIYSLLINSALKFVSLRPRSYKEINDYIDKRLNKLKVVKDPELLKKQVLERLSELGYADDYAFASWWVKSRANSNPKGIFVLKHELQLKGLSPAVIQNILDEIANSNISQTEDNSYFAGGLKIARKKNKSMTNLSYNIKRNKLYLYLKQRGYEHEMITKIIDSVLGKDYNTSVIE